MSIHTYFKSLISTSTRRRPTRRSPPVSRLCVEALEDRWVPSFSPAVTYDVVNPHGVATADFNADGRLDLAVSNSDSNTISVLLGNGDGTLQAAQTSSTRDNPESLQAADLNGDGKADLVVHSGYNGGYALALLLGKGDGTFQPPQNIVLPYVSPPGYTGSLGQTPTSVAVGDLNGDGKLDLVARGLARYFIVISDDPTDIINEYHDNDYVNVLLGNGDGTFGTGTAYRVYGGYSPAGLYLGDFNGDARTDAVTREGVMLGNGDGTLQAPRNFLGCNKGITNPVGDFNGDGNLDVLASDGFGYAVMLGNGDGTFRTGAHVDRGRLVGDVNADGKLDIVSAGGSGYAVMLGYGDGSFAPPIYSDLGTPPANSFGSAALGDFDGDGFPDLAASAPDNYAYDDDGVIVDYYPGFVAVAHNDGNWTVPPPQPSIGVVGHIAVTEGNTGARAATFTVALSVAYPGTVTVNYATYDSTAGAGEYSADYQAVSGTLTFAPGETSKTIAVQVNGDRRGEWDETFGIILSSPTNGTIAAGRYYGLCTIRDDEPRISIGDVTRAEGKKGQTTLFTFTVTLSAAYDQPVTMSFRTVNGTATTSNGDYVAKTGTLTFAPGETTKTITIEVKGDSKREVDETFYLDLFGNSGNSLFTKNRGLGTILNDD